MSGDAPDEYELADDPDLEQPANDQTTKPRPQSPRAPGQPLPRMWKSEADDDGPPPIPVKPPSEPAPAPSRRAKTSTSGGTGRTIGLKPKNEPGEKKVLIEETPAFDTFEARQRGRMLTGALIVVIIGLGIYVGYHMFLHDPFPMDDLPPDDGSVAQGPVEPKLDFDFEAKAMLSRAREAAKNGKTDEAVALLESLVKTYKTTPSAGEAREALKRPSQNLPLFLDRPTVKADAPAPPAPVQTAPSPVVVAQAPAVQAQGNATLTLPVNPSELTPSTLPSSPPSATEAEGSERVLPAGFTAKAETGMDPSGWPLMIVGDRDGAPMVFVPGGVFTMGEDRDQTFAAPAHQVRLAGYYIDQHEVTVRQFHLFLAETRYRGRPNWTWTPPDEREKATVDPMPMIMVNANDAQAYAEWAGKKLPTEAQWEIAARTSDGRVYPWGNEPPRYPKARPSRQIDPVMSFPEDRSPYGVFDLAGNVYEWTADLFDPSYYRSIAGQITDNPTGAQARAGRSELVVKGGKTGAASAREPMAPDKRLNYVGFRCALQVERPTITASPTPAAAPPAPTQPRRPAANVNPPAEPF